MKMGILLSMLQEKRIIKEYYEKWYSNKLDNLNQRDKFLKTYTLPKLAQEIKNLNRLKQKVKSVEHLLTE